MINIKGYAHLGDALWELVVREIIVCETGKLNELHKLTIQFVNAQFQNDLLELLSSLLNEEELDILRRARNIKTSSQRRINQTLHRNATAFEAVLGYLYINNRQKYDFIVDKLKPEIFKNF